MSETNTKAKKKASADDAGAVQSNPEGQEAAAQADAEERQRTIAEAAYYKAEQRGFAPGMEADDWLEAEREVAEA